MPTQIISLPATHLAAKLRTFRREFISKYIQPEIDYPFFEGLYELGSLPSPVTFSGDSALRFIGGRGHLAIKSGMLTNTGPKLDCPFEIEVFNRSDKVLVHLPKVLEIRSVFNTATLKLGFVSPLPVTFLNRPIWGDIQEPPLPLQTLLKQMTFSDSALDYDLTDVLASGNVWVLRLKL